MPLPQGFVKAKLEISGGEPIECAFNPAEYTVSKTNIWTYKPNQGKDMPDPEFGGGLPQVYKLSLLLDSTVKRPGGPAKKVSEIANKLMEAYHGGGSAPKFIKFSWGSVQLPEAAPVSIQIRYALFESNGEPRRAFVDLELAQAKDNKTVSTGQNPTTRSIPGLRVHRVHDGDTLPSIAFKHYRDATQWRVVAEANDISNPLALRRGTNLSIPRIES
jgi:Contractile injection system tube protein/LysM domain